MAKYYAANMTYKNMLFFTKLDKNVSYWVMGCPVSFLTVGQNIPKGIETTSGQRIAGCVARRRQFLLKSEEERKR